MRRTSALLLPAHDGLPDEAPRAGHSRPWARRRHRHHPCHMLLLHHLKVLTPKYPHSDLISSCTAAPQPGAGYAPRQQRPCGGGDPRSAVYLMCPPALFGSTVLPPRSLRPRFVLAHCQRGALPLARTAPSRKARQAHHCPMPSKSSTSSPKEARQSHHSPLPSRSSAR